MDREETVFGVRTLSLDSVHGLRINGKTLKLKGGCIHHDNGVLGAATFADAELRRARLMKEAGYNALRSAHHPMGKAMLRACDQLGLVVMDEFTDVWTKSKCDYDYSIHFPHWWEQHVEAMVNKDYNHPCVVMYSTGNEIPEFGSRIGSSWGKKIGDKIRSLDKTRYLTNGINVMFAVMDRIGEIASLLGQEGVEAGEINEMMTNRRKLMDQINNSDVADRFLEESCSGLDIVGYNYAAQRYEREHEKISLPGVCRFGDRPFRFRRKLGTGGKTRLCNRGFHLDCLGIPGRSGDWPGAVWGPGFLLWGIPLDFLPVRRF